MYGDEEKEKLRSATLNIKKYHDLDYKFELSVTCSLASANVYYKISKKVFARMTKKGEEFIFLDDLDLTKDLYKDFLAFVKKTPRQRKKKVDHQQLKLGRTNYIGIWKKSLFNIFRKIPNLELTSEFFDNKYQELISKIRQ